MSPGWFPLIVRLSRWTVPLVKSTAPSGKIKQACRLAEWVGDRPWHRKPGINPSCQPASDLMNVSPDKSEAELLPAPEALFHSCPWPLTFLCQKKIPPEGTQIFNTSLISNTSLLLRWNFASLKTRGFQEEIRMYLGFVCMNCMICKSAAKIKAGKEPKIKLQPTFTKKQPRVTPAGQQ